jgi:hypothetical protein
MLLYNKGIVDMHSKYMQYQNQTGSLMSSILKMSENFIWFGHKKHKLLSDMRIVGGQMEGQSDYFKVDTDTWQDTN